MTDRLTGAEVAALTGLRRHIAALRAALPKGGVAGW